MKKKAASWIPSGLFTIITALATLYCLLEYRESVLMIGIASLLLLASAFWLFTCINRIARERAEAANDIGKEQRERMNYEGMKLQGEELIRLVNSLGKGIYVYNKRSSEYIQALYDHVLQTGQTNEEFVNLLIQNQTKTAKFQVKYNQDETNRLIIAIKENNEKLNQSLEQSLSSLQSGTLSGVETDPAIINYLNELSGRLGEITACVQTLQAQFDAFSSGGAIAVPANSEPEAELPSMETPEPEVIAEEIPEPVAEEPVAEEPVVEEPVVEEPAIEEPAIEEPAVDTISTEPVVSEEESTASSEAAPAAPLISDDPNKQLTPEEIAALFASLG